MTMDSKALTRETVHEYFEKLYSNDHFKYILEMIADLYNVRIELRESSEQSRQHRFDWLIDDGGSGEQYNNFYAEKRIIIDVFPSSEDKGKF